MAGTTSHTKRRAVAIKRRAECRWFNDWYRSTRLGYSSFAKILGTTGTQLAHRLWGWRKSIVPPDLGEWLDRYEAFLVAAHLETHRARRYLMVRNCEVRVPDLPDCLQPRAARLPLTPAEAEQCRRFAEWVRRTRFNISQLGRVLDTSKSRLNHYVHGRSRLRDRDIAEWLANYTRFLDERLAGLDPLRERATRDSIHRT